MIVFHLVQTPPIPLKFISSSTQQAFQAIETVPESPESTFPPVQAPQKPARTHHGVQSPASHPGAEISASLRPQAGLAPPWLIPSASDVYSLRTRGLPPHTTAAGGQPRPPPALPINSSNASAGKVWSSHKTVDAPLECWEKGPVITGLRLPQGTLCHREWLCADSTPGCPPTPHQATRRLLITELWKRTRDKL